VASKQLKAKALNSIVGQANQLAGKPDPPKRVLSRTAEQHVLQAYMELGGIGPAARKAGVTTSAVFAHQKYNPEFAQKLEQARLDIASRVEASVLKRAVRGHNEKVFYKGEIVGVQRKPSDSLAMFWLKSHVPERYGDKLETRNLNVNASVRDLSTDELKAMIDKAKGE
jgi:hypothetical protein